MGLIDITGKRFGRYVVLRFAGKNKHNQSTWLCRCDCGREKVVQGLALKSGRTKSCGCLSAEKRRAKLIKHGHTAHGVVTQEYSAWTNMRNRCNNPNDDRFADYGGRGITVCERWNDFDKFLADMGQKPSDDHQLDRKDNDRGYSPDNCRWATRKQQQRNMRSNRLVSYSGETRSVTEWAERLEINAITLWARLNRGWTIDEAMNTAVKKPRRVVSRQQLLTGKGAR